jgi:hypothetical protein
MSIASRAVAAPVQRCTVRTPDGGHITDGIAVLIERPGGREARVTELTEPGALLMAYVGRGVRRFSLEFENGEDHDAELLGTSWQSSGRRVCRFTIGSPPAGVSADIALTDAAILMRAD